MLNKYNILFFIKVSYFTIQLHHYNWNKIRDTTTNTYEKYSEINKNIKIQIIDYSKKWIMFVVAVAIRKMK